MFFFFLILLFSYNRSDPEYWASRLFSIHVTLSQSRIKNTDILVQEISIFVLILVYIIVLHALI